MSLINDDDVVSHASSYQRRGRQSETGKGDWATAQRKEWGKQTGPPQSYAGHDLKHQAARSQLLLKS